MILIVADTGPLNYLIQIELVHLLESLADKTVLPHLVQAELLHPLAPTIVRTWASCLPDWVEVRRSEATLSQLDLAAADQEAIALARETAGALLLIDDRQARLCAQKFGVRTLGTVGLLEAAARRDLVQLPQALASLQATSCYLAEDIVKNALVRDAGRRRTQP